MADDKTKAEKALRKLGQYFHRGLPKLHPMTDQQMSKVRDAVRQQWEQTHKGQAQNSASLTSSPSRSKTKQQQQTKSQSEDHGEDHGHSY